LFVFGINAVVFLRYNANFVSNINLGMTLDYRYFSFGVIALFLVIFVILSLNDTAVDFIQKPTVKITKNVHKASEKPNLAKRLSDDIFNNDNLANVVNDEHNVNLSPVSSEVLLPFDNIEQAKLEAEDKIQQILRGEAKAQDFSLNKPVIDVDFKPSTQVDYRQKFSQSKEVLFNVKVSNRDYQLDLKRTNDYTDGGDWYSGYVKDTDTKVRVKAFSNKVTIYIYEPEGRIKVSKTLNEKQKYFNDKNKLEDKANDIASSFFETQNDYYVIDEGKAEYISENEIYETKAASNDTDYNDTIIPKRKNQ